MLAKEIPHTLTVSDCAGCCRATEEDARRKNGLVNCYVSFSSTHDDHESTHSYFSSVMQAPRPFTDVTLCKPQLLSSLNHTAARPNHTTAVNTEKCKMVWASGREKADKMSRSICTLL